MMSRQLRRRRETSCRRSSRQSLIAVKTDCSAAIQVFSDSTLLCLSMVSRLTAFTYCILVNHTSINDAYLIPSRDAALMQCDAGA